MSVSFVSRSVVLMQEYLGSYIADEAGRLVFREGALVTALRRGHWVVLDELNLAPSEVLEALNRRDAMRRWTGPDPCCSLQPPPRQQVTNRIVERLFKRGMVQDA